MEDPTKIRLSQDQIKDMNQFYQDIILLEEDESVNATERLNNLVSLKQRIQNSGNYSMGEKNNILERIDNLEKKLSS